MNSIVQILLYDKDNYDILGQTLEILIRRILFFETIIIKVIIIQTIYIF